MQDADRSPIWPIILSNIPTKPAIITFISNPANLFSKIVYITISIVAPKVPPIHPSIVLFGLIL